MEMLITRFKFFKSLKSQISSLIFQKPNKTRSLVMFFRDVFLLLENFKNLCITIKYLRNQLLIFTHHGLLKATFFLFYKKKKKIFPFSIKYLFNINCGMKCTVVGIKTPSTNSGMNYRRRTLLVLNY